MASLWSSCVHLPQRNCGVRYTEVLSDIAQCGEALADGFIIVLGDFKHFVPEHPESLEFLDSMSAELVVQGNEGRLHKDWVATDYTRVCLRRVSYETQWPTTLVSWGTSCSLKAP